MDCRHVQDAILDSMIDRDALPSAVAAHLADCAACAAFATHQTALETGLRQMLVTPTVRAGLRAAVRERLREERRPVWRDGLPDVVHFASCGVATVVSLLTLPFDPTVVLVVGLATTLASHAVLTAMHGSLDAAGESGV